MKLGRSPMGDGFLVHPNSPDQTALAIPFSRFEIKKDKVRIKVDAVGGSFEGKLHSKNKTMRGTWKQLADLPLELEWSKALPKHEPK